MVYTYVHPKKANEGEKERNRKKRKGRQREEKKRLARVGWRSTGVVSTDAVIAAAGRLTTTPVVTIITR